MTDLLAAQQASPRPPVFPCVRLVLLHIRARSAGAEQPSSSCPLPFHNVVKKPRRCFYRSHALRLNDRKVLALIGYTHLT